MKIYTMKLTGLDYTALAIANTKLGLLKNYNKYLKDCNCQKITLADLENEINVSILIENGNFNNLGE